MFRYQLGVIRMAAIFSLIGCVLVIVLDRTSAQNTAPTNTTANDKPVEQVQKNIQVLKGLPTSQLTPVMNYMAASLGVRCNYCHVNKEGVWDFAADDKGEKKSAREMITMVMGINKNNFHGNAEVSCYTCHRGRTTVAHTLSMPLPTPEQAPSAAPSPGSSTQANPTADQVLDKYYQALGGLPTIEKLTSRVMKGTLTSNNGVEMGYELNQSGSDSVLAILTTTQSGVFKRGFDGTMGWEKSATGTRELTNDEIVYLHRYPALFTDIKLKDQFTRVSFGGKPKIDGRDVYALRATSATGKREMLFFDVESGLLVRRTTSTTTLVGIIPEQVDFADYREVDGLKMPFTIRVSAIDPTYSVVRKFTEMKLNVPIDAKRFKKPE